MKKIDVSVHGPNAKWSFTVAEVEYLHFLKTLKSGDPAYLNKRDFRGNVVEVITFFPNMIVAVEVREPVWSND